MTQYARGAAVEHQLKAQLEAQGYFVVRSAGSHGPIDLCALRDGEQPLLIQCKRGRVTRADLLALAYSALPAGATVELWRYLGRGEWQTWRRIGREMQPTQPRERCIC